VFLKFANLSALFNGNEIYSKITELNNLRQTIEKLSIYANLLQNLPNLTEITRILPRIIQIIELIQSERDLIELFGQFMTDLHILTNHPVILQLSEISQMFVDFLQRYDHMSELNIN